MALVACDPDPTAPAVDESAACEVTLTRKHCVSACDATGSRTFTDPRAAGTGCGGNTEQGCFYETATGNLWSSPSTTFGTVNLEGFRSCTATETRQMVGGPAADGGTDAETASTLCASTITRVRCASKCAQVTTTRVFVERRPIDSCGGNEQVGCLYELATGDLWTSPTTSYLQGVFDEFRECTATEQALVQEE